MTDESFNSPKLCCLKEMLVSKNKEKSLCGENNKSAALLGYLDMGKCRSALHLHPRKKSNELEINKMKVINTTTSTSTSTAPRQFLFHAVNLFLFSVGQRFFGLPLLPCGWVIVYRLLLVCWSVVMPVSEASLNV